MKAPVNGAPWYHSFLDHWLPFFICQSTSKMAYDGQRDGKKKLLSNGWSIPKRVTHRDLCQPNEDGLQARTVHLDLVDPER